MLSLITKSINGFLPILDIPKFRTLVNMQLIPYINFTGKPVSEESEKLIKLGNRLVYASYVLLLLCIGYVFAGTNH